MPCFYIPHLQENDKFVSITGDEYHHIKNVFRKKLNDTISLSNGDGVFANTKITHITKKQIDTEIVSISKIKKSKPHLSFAFALLRNKNDFFIVEKLTELGIKDFYPITTDRTVRKPNNNTNKKFTKTAISAIKQCDNAYLPNIHDSLSLKDLFSHLKKKNIIPIVASEIERKRFINDVFQFDNNDYCIIIGPEGGFSDNEFSYFEENNILTFCLGNHVMRAETAAICATSQILGNILTYNKDYY